jgi:hypothetical protein
MNEKCATQILESSPSFIEVMTELYKYIIFKFYQEYNIFEYLNERFDTSNCNKAAQLVRDNVIKKNLNFSKRQGLSDVWLIKPEVKKGSEIKR